MIAFIKGLIYPFSGKKSSLRFLTGCGVSLIPLMGQLMVLGYSIRSMEGVISGEEELPPWVDLPGLFISGVKFLGVLFIYSLGFIIPFSISMFSILIVAENWSISVGIVILLFSVILFLTGIFFFPLALFYMVRRGERFGATLEFSNVLMSIKGRTFPYIMRNIYFGVFLLIFLVLAFFVSSSDYGFLILLMTIPMFYLLLFASYLYGKMGDVSHDTSIVIPEISGSVSAGNETTP